MEWDEFKNLLSSLPYSCDQIESRLRQVNFSGYFERYEVVLSLFRNDSTPIFNSNSAIYLSESYFKTQILREGKQTVSDGLFFIDKTLQKRALFRRFRVGSH